MEGPAFRSAQINRPGSDLSQRTRPPGAGPRNRGSVRSRFALLLTREA